MLSGPSSGPSRSALLGLVLAVLLLHGLLLMTSPLTVNIGASVQPTAVQARLVTLPVPEPPAPAKPRPPRTRQAAVAAAAPPVEQVREQKVDPPGPQPSTLSDSVGSERPAQVAQAASETQWHSAVAPEAQALATDLAAGQKNASPSDAPALQQAGVPAQALFPASATQIPPAAAGTPWPALSPDALPASRLLNYQLTGMDKGFTYHASGELRWQHNQRDYELTLAVRAFLIGRRQWRSVGRIDASGLAPVRFSDSWRNERAAHFDRESQRIVFSSNSTPAALQTGAQDQISLYVQLAAAMASGSSPFAPGTRLQVQTATVRDAQPWLLVLEGGETLVLDGQSLPVLKWTCQPRNRFEARVEFWVAAEQAWLPLRIRITQNNGSFIDLAFRSAEPLPPLPAQGDAQQGRTSS